MTIVTKRFADAVNYARIAHGAQVRKGTQIPYLYHLLGVASLVMEFGGNEDQAIAGLLHDVLEDCGAAHERMIRAEFGDVVAGIVKDCTDGTAESKSLANDAEAKRADWLRRKLAYLDHLKQESDEALLVSACDKLHNARAVVGDLEDPEVGPRVFERFTAGMEGTLRYYYSLSEIFSSRSVAPARAVAQIVDQMHQLANAGSPTPFSRRGLR
jgi:(p)ppGpp synthase/HD superfamily hydrolase